MSRYEVHYFTRGLVASSTVLEAEDLIDLGGMLDVPACRWEISRPIELEGGAELAGYRGRQLVVLCRELPELRDVLAPARLESAMPHEWMGVEPDDFNDEHLQPLMELREIEGRLAQLEEAHAG